jgi:ABC-2 type transport system permease protein
MNLFWRELRFYRNSTIIWACALAVLTVVFLELFPAFTKDVAASQKILSNLPMQLREALGISLQYFFTIYGFYAYMLTFILLAASVQAMNLGVGIISKEVGAKTADFLLTKPLSRSTVLTSKIAAAAALIVATNTLLIVISTLTAIHISTDSFDENIFLLLIGTIFLVQLAFLALGLLFGVLLPKVKSVIAVSLPVVFAIFIVSTLGAIIGNETVRYISFFKFFDTTYIIRNTAYEPKFLIIEAAFLVSAVLVSYVVFIKKDVQAS